MADAFLEQAKRKESKQDRAAVWAGMAVAREEQWSESWSANWSTEADLDAPDLAFLFWTCIEFRELFQQV